MNLFKELMTADKFKAYYEALQVIFEDWPFLVKAIGIFFLVIQPTLLLINLKMKTFLLQ